MLLPKKAHKDGDILSFKMVSGEEIVAKLISETDTKITIGKPIGVGVDHQGRVAMAPFMVSLPDDVAEVTVMASNVMFMALAREEIKNAYIANTTGIQPAAAGQLGGLAGDQAGKAPGSGHGGFNPNK